MMKKDMSKPTRLPPKLDGYEDLLRDIRSILENGLSRAYPAVDNLKVQTQWQIGDRIVREKLKHKDRADYGKQAISKLGVPKILSHIS
jgi:hypothetical protein